MSPDEKKKSWSETMGQMFLCGHTMAQHLYHDSKDFPLTPCEVVTPLRSKETMNQDESNAEFRSPEKAWLMINEYECRVTHADVKDLLETLTWLDVKFTEAEKKSNEEAQIKPI
jgi:hypothetical protein